MMLWKAEKFRLPASFLSILPCELQRPPGSTASTHLWNHGVLIAGSVLQISKAGKSWGGGSTQVSSMLGCHETCNVEPDGKILNLH